METDGIKKEASSGAAGTGKWLLTAALSLLAVSLYVHFLSASSADKNWLLAAARKLLSGRKLYTDIFEINPPLIVWLYTVPEYVSQHLQFLSDYNVLALMGFAFIAFVIAVSERLIVLHPAFGKDRKKRIVFVLLLAFVFIFCTAPMYFFDREHIFLVLTFPYVLRFSPMLARQPLPLRLRLCIGALAALGFCIKPHTLAVFAVLQLLYLIRERTPAILVSMENLIIYVVGALYVGFILLFMPDYLHTVLPMAMATYSAYNSRVNGIYSLIVFTVIMGVSFADFRPRHRSPLRRDIYYFLGVCVAFLIYALMNNGWAYTYNPLISYARILTGWLLLEFAWLKHDAMAHGLSARKFVFGERACSFNLICNLLFYTVCFGAFLYPTDCDNSISCRSTSQFFKEAKQVPAHSFGVMSLEFSKWSELNRETGEAWDTRFNHLWMLPKFILSGPEFAEKNKWIIDYVGNAYAEDLNRWKPDVVFVDASPELFYNHPHIDLPGFIGGIAAFREAWSHYHLERTIDACQKAPPGEPASKAIKFDCRFDVFRRTAAP